MPIFIATGPIDPASNEIRGFRRDTQEDAEAMAAANSRPNQPWTVYELIECSSTVVDTPRLVRKRQPMNPSIRAGDDKQ
jgi:hypothetical protein